MVNRLTGERGQLILIGALTVALLVVGVTITINTVLFVENTATDEGAVVVNQAAEVTGELRSAVQSTTLHVNHQSRNHGPTQLENYVESNVSKLESVMSQQYLQSRSLSVNVSIEDTTEGTRVVQAADANFTDDFGGSDWDPISSGSRIGWFVVNLNATEDTGGSFDAVVSNGSEDVTVRITRENASAYEVESTGPSGGSAKTTCRTRGNRLVLDVHRGQSPTDLACQFNGTGEVRNATSVEFTGGDNAFGRYGIVTADSSVSSVPNCPSSGPCHTPAIWSVEFETTVAGSEFVLSSDHNVTVYPRRQDR